MLAELAVSDEAAFAALVEIARANVPAQAAARPEPSRHRSTDRAPGALVLTNPRSDRVRSVRGLARRAVRVRTGRFVVDGPQGVREAVRYAADRVLDVYVTPDAAQRHERHRRDGPRGVAAGSTRRATRSWPPWPGPTRPRGCSPSSARTPASLGRHPRRRPAGARRARPRARPRQRGHRHPRRRRPRRRRGARQRGVRRRPRPQGRPVDGRLALPPAGRHGARPHRDPRDAARPRHPHPCRRRRRDDAPPGRRPHVGARLGDGQRGLGADRRGAHGCDDVVAVPIRGHAESLNLAMAATVCLYASSLQRSAPPAR